MPNDISDKAASDPNGRRKPGAAGDLRRRLRSRPDVGGKHQNDIGEDGFNYYAAYFEDSDGQYYRVVFSSGVNAADETVYSIGAMSERKRPASFGSSAPKDGALNAAAFSETSITQAARESKTQNPDGQKSYGGSLSELNARLAKLSEEEKRALKAENRRQKVQGAGFDDQLRRAVGMSFRSTRRVTISFGFDAVTCT